MPEDVYNVNTVRPYHHGDLRRALVDTALLLLQEEGVEALTLRGVARRTGVSAMAPYRHFADKAALLSAVANEGFAALLKRQIEADSAPDPRLALAGQGLAYVQFARDRPALFRLMFGPWPGAVPAKSGEPDTAPRESFELLKQRVRTLVPADLADRVTIAAWGFVHGLALLALDGRLPEEPKIEQTIMLFANRMTAM